MKKTEEYLFFVLVGLVLSYLLGLLDSFVFHFKVTQTFIGPFGSTEIYAFAAFLVGIFVSRMKK